MESKKIKIEHMNRIVLLLIFLISILPTVNAQDFNAGVYSGVITSQIDGDRYKGYNKTGFLFGGYVNREFAKKWYWQSGLRYIQKGSRRVDSKSGVYYKAQLNYAEVPLTVRYEPYKKVDFEGGFTFGYLVKAQEDKDGYGLEEADPPFNKFELGLLLGVNYNFSKKWSTGAFFCYSILPVRPYSSGYEDFMDRGQYNNLLYVSLTYKLPSWK